MFIFSIISIIIISHIESQIISPIRFIGACCVLCKTCEYPNRGCLCPLYVIVEGYSCPDGEVRNEADNDTCVAVNSKQCRAQRNGSFVHIPPACGRNEIRELCGFCGATCAQPEIACGRCVCLSGYLRDRNGVCILANSLRCRAESITPVTSDSPSR